MAERFVSRDSNKKNISSLTALQKKRKLIIESKFDLIEKTFNEVKIERVAFAEGDENLPWRINQEKKAEEKEFKAAQAIVNRRTGQAESS